MPISDYQPERRTIHFKGNALCTVEGVSLDTLGVLVRTHMPDFEAIFDIIADPKLEAPDFNVHLGQIAVAIASQAPGLAANIIAVCQKDEPTSLELVNHCRRLPMAVQVEILISIAEMTFEEAGSIKKTVESLMMMIARMRAKSTVEKANPPKTASPAYIRDSGAT